jgi:hypothetical protein
MGAIPPAPVEDIRFSFAYAGAMGEMKRQNAREEEARLQDRFASTIVIAAAIICAVRLARDDISRPSPRLFAAVADSVSLASLILRRVTGR